MGKVISLLLLLLTVTGGASLAQGSTDSVLLDHEYVFLDGIYEDFRALRQNRPSRSWSTVSAGKVVRLQDDYRIQIETDPSQPAAITSTFAVVVDGIPYLRSRWEEQRAFVEFAGLRVRGRLCYLAYDTLVAKTFEVKAYNPATGKPFRRGNVTRTEREAVERVFDFRTGQLYPLDQPTLLRLVADDPEIRRAISVLADDEQLPEALFRALKIYDERHPFWMPRTSAQ